MVVVVVGGGIQVPQTNYTQNIIFHLICVTLFGYLSMEENLPQPKFLGDIPPKAFGWRGPVPHASDAHEERCRASGLGTDSFQSSILCMQRPKGVMLQPSNRSAGTSPPPPLPGGTAMYADAAHGSSR